VRFGIVSNKKLLKRYKLDYGNLWFDEDSKSYTSIIVKRFDEKVTKIGLSDHNVDTL
jgi:hypothetical protein